ncbi:MAG TPA: response regulator [Thermomicrobiales bacterium]|jgi:CheY-like chemotaxis protein
MAHPHILVVEDSEEIRDLIADTLTDEGYAVECASNGAEALVAVERDAPALVLLDLHMPVLDGWGFARALTARALHIPIIVLTAATNAARYSKELGAVGCIRKPFALMDLLKTVDQAFRAAPATSAEHRHSAV